MDVLCFFVCVIVFVALAVSPCLTHLPLSHSVNPRPRFIVCVFSFRQPSIPAAVEIVAGYARCASSYQGLCVCVLVRARHLCTIASYAYRSVC
jgi:hypothetical protein